MVVRDVVRTKNRIKSMYRSRGVAVAGKSTALRVAPGSVPVSCWSSAGRWTSGPPSRCPGRASVLLEFCWKVDERRQGSHAGSPAIARMASGGDGQHDHFVVKAVAIGLASVRSGQVGQRVAYRCHSPDRSCPLPLRQRSRQCRGGQPRSSRGVERQRWWEKDQRGNMSANSRARSRRRWAPERKALTKAR